METDMQATIAAACAEDDGKLPAKVLQDWVGRTLRAEENRRMSPSHLSPNALDASALLVFLFHAGSCQLLGRKF